MRERRRLTTQFFSRMCTLVFMMLAAGCTSSTRQSSTSVTHSVLPNGSILLEYSHLPADRTHAVGHDLAIGVGQGEPEYMFGDVRGIDASQDGTIYVLDYQSADVRAFDSAGQYLSTIASPGEGPGELSRANGMMLVGDSSLWVQDHGKWKMLVLDRTGTEQATYTMPLLSYGYIWNGTVDNSGVLWNPGVSSEEQRTLEPEAGLRTGRLHGYLIGVDPKTSRRDSISLGPVLFRTFVTVGNGGFSMSRIPFDPVEITRVDPDGGYWRATSNEYRITRVSASGDTTIVIDVALDVQPVTESDRTNFVDGAAKSNPDRRNTAESIAAFMPDTKPIIDDLVIDDIGRVWVRRSADPANNTRYDVFSERGEYLGSVITNFATMPYFSIRVRGNRIYSLSADPEGFHRVVRTPPIILRDPEPSG